MGLETSVTHIDDLDPAFPTAGDSAAQGDDHLRNIKSALKNTFPNITDPVTATAAEVNALIGKGMPTGGIIMWSGAIVNIPTGWALCNGLNGTPDLRNRFVLGAGSTYTEFDTGGAESVTLSVSNLPSHDHGNGNLATSKEGKHSHNITVNNAGRHRHNETYEAKTGSSGNVQDGDTPIAGRLNGSYNTDLNTSFDGSHTHNASASDAGDHTHNITGRTGDTGGGTSFSTMPKYFALAYIMKT